MALDQPFGLGGGGGLNWNAGGVSDIASGIASLFGGGGKNPYEAAMPYINQMTQGNKYNEPYQKAGAGATNMLMQQVAKLLGDPTGLQKQWGQAFQESPGYQWGVEQATKAANQAAAAGGMGGTAQNQYNVAHDVMGLANQDYYNFIDKIMSMFGMGLQTGQGVAQTGANSAQQMAQALMQQAAAQASAAAQGANWENQNSPWNAIGKVVQGGLSLIPGL